VAKSFRSLGASDSGILRLNYQRNTVDVDDAVNQLKAQKVPIKAVVMISAYRPAAKFIEKTRDLFPIALQQHIIRRQHSARDELMLLGPRYAAGAIVTQSCRRFPATRPLFSNTRMPWPNIFPARRRITCRWRAMLWQTS